jgi:hypothetical protein
VNEIKTAVDGRLRIAGQAFIALAYKPIRMYDTS